MSLPPIQLHRIVESIKTQDFAFDPEDVVEDVDAVLRFYGFLFELDEQDRAQLIQDLLPIAEACAEREVVRNVTSDLRETGLLQPSYVEQLRTTDESSTDAAWLLAMIAARISSRQLG